MFTIEKKETQSCESGCCSPKPKGKAVCPKCGKEGKGVPAVTLEHLLTRDALVSVEGAEGWYYCKTPVCEAVYFKEEEVLVQNDLTVMVGLKEGTVPGTLCYCFGWTKEKITEELRTKGETAAIDDIKAKMKDPGCSCETLNPSGACCLGDVAKAIKTLNAAY